MCIRDRVKSVVAKGKTATMNFIKNAFDKSIGRVVKSSVEFVQSAYAKAKANSKKEMKRQIEELKIKVGQLQNPVYVQEKAKEIEQKEMEEKIRYFHSDEFNLDPEKIKAEEERIAKEKAELEKRKAELNQVKNQASMDLDSDLSEEIEEVRTRAI